MTAKQLGTPLAPKSPEPLKQQDSKTPGFGWELSDTARKDIEEIEANAREAEQRIGALTLR